MACGDANWCEVKMKCFSDSTIKNTNKCKSFEFNPIDALAENDEEYKPREKYNPRKKKVGEQLSLFEEESNEN